jgi:hypothetical protein
VNYEFDPEWTRDWESGLQSRNSLRVNVGSVSTDDFLTDVELHVTEPIASRFRLLYDLHWFEALHVRSRDTQHFLGFEFAAASWLGLQGQVHPASNKEELDLRFGALIHDEGRESYARILVRWDDPLFSEKNDVGGVGEQTATSLDWVARGVFGRLEVFSEGLYGSAGERSYPDPMAMPLLEADSSRLNWSVSRVRALADLHRFVELEFAHHEYESSETLRGTVAPDACGNRLFNLALRGVWRFDGKWRARGELHRVDQQAAIGETDYAREEWMPAFWLGWAPGRVHLLELGYMATGYTWEGAPSPPYSEDGYRQKVELSWLIKASERAGLQFSLSHEPDPQRFGGANVQVQVGF